jgi:hypothetical protein
MEAHAAGRGFMSYGQTRRRLARALASAAATGKLPELMSAVFGDAA